MDTRILNLYLSRILSGYFIFIHNNIKYKLVYPDVNLKYDAELYAQEEYEKNKFNNWINDDEILFMLINMGIWSFDSDTKLASLEKSIEDTKVEIFKNFINPPRLKQLRKTLSSHKKNYNRQYEARHSLDHITPKGYSQWIKNQYILIHSLYDSNDKRVFTDIADADSRLLFSLSSTINDNNIDVEIFRYIARSDIWRNYWSSNKDRIFNKSVVDWTDEQKTLVVISKMYDSAYEHPECPIEGIIEDDDAFDGWMIAQKRENEKNRNKKRTEKMLGNKLNKAGEVFLVANSKDEAQNIYDLNDPSAMNTIKERSSVILTSDKEVNDASLPDVKRNLQVQRNQLMMTRK